MQRERTTRTTIRKGHNRTIMTGFRWVLYIKSCLRSVGQHQRNGPVVDPDQSCQTHRVQTGDVRYRCRAVRFHVLSLRLSQPEHS